MVIKYPSFDFRSLRVTNFLNSSPDTGIGRYDMVKDFRNTSSKKREVPTCVQSHKRKTYYEGNNNSEERVKKKIVSYG